MSEKGAGRRIPIEQAEQDALSVAELKKLMLSIRTQFEPRPEGGMRGRNTRGSMSSSGLFSTGVEYRLRRRCCYLIRRSARNYLRNSWEYIPATPTWRSQNLSPSHVHELSVLFDSLPQRVLYVDLETCGLGEAPIFLLGVLRYDESAEEWVVEQYLARSYEEEPTLLLAFWRLAMGCSALATFNGKSFDYPLLEGRSARYRISRPRMNRRSADRSRRGPRWVHCDVLHYVRRLWRDRYDLPNCRLLTLEYAICGRERDADIPGWEMQRVYEDFVRSGRTSEMELVLEHNFQDLVTLAELSFRILAEVAG